jgi:hypothetical protein
MNDLVYVLKKVPFIIVEIAKMSRKHKMYFLLPVCVLLAILALVAFYIGPSVIVSFIYAGV